MKGSVRKRGEKWSYYFTIKVDGTYKKKEKSGFRTKKEAETALREVLQQYEKQGFVQNNVSYTLQEFSNYWYENVASNSCRYNTLVQYNSMLKNHIIPELGFIKMTSITPEILQKFFAEKQKSLSNLRARLPLFHGISSIFFLKASFVGHLRGCCPILGQSSGLCPYRFCEKPLILNL